MNIWADVPYVLLEVPPSVSLGCWVVACAGSASCVCCSGLFVLGLRYGFHCRLYLAPALRHFALALSEQISSLGVVRLCSSERFQTHLPGVLNWPCAHQGNMH